MDVVHQLEIEPGMSVNALVERMSHCGFGAQKTGAGYGYL